MCMMCDGGSREELIERQKRHIETVGWSVVAVEASRRCAPFGYTIGLTRFEGHPELLITGLEAHLTGVALNGFAEEVQAGRRFAAGDLEERFGGRLKYQFVRVNNPRRLLHAQLIYASAAGLVPALQVVYSAPNGCWPWQRGHPGGRRSQPLYGKPLYF